MPARRSVFAVASLLLAGALSAADVTTDVSTRETYVGLPILLQFHINNASDHEEPVMPEVDGLEIESAGPPSRSSQISIVNGRKSQRLTVTYSFRVTPQREGTFTIPPVKIVAGNYSTISKAVRIVASKSDTDDLMFVEIEGKAKEIYVGEALDLTLKIWIRPYRNSEYQITLDEGDMWSLISKQTSWGSFADSLEKMAEDRKRPGGRQVLREDSSGNEREYLLYEIDATVYPNRPGRIDGNDVRIILDYPVELGRSRSPFSILDDDDFFGASGLFDDSFFRGFGSRLGITKSRPIVAETTLEPIIVKPIPEQGRPDDYLGAVGQYTIITEAEPKSVKVGDPITLRIGIDGTGPMDLVRAPPLASQQSLTKDFKVPDEPLPGFVKDSRKVFSTTIRPLRDGVTEIPPISFSYFDPEKKQYVTTTSDPIAIEVEKADVLALDAIVGAIRPNETPASGGPPASEKPPATELKLFAGAPLLSNVERPSILPSSLLAMLVGPPLVFLAILLFASRHVASGFVSARRRFRESVSAAQTADEIGAALEQYLTTRFRLARSRLTRDQTIGRLRASGCQELAIRAERLYAHCEKASANPPYGLSMESLQEEALQLVNDLTQKSSSARTPSKIKPLSSTTAVALVCALAFPQFAGAETGGDESGGDGVALSVEQQRVLLDEALSIYASASSQPSGDAQEQFARSAGKFQLIVDSGVANDRLFFDLATAQLRAGQTAKAIANYRRALRLDPANPLYYQQLAAAENLLPREAEWMPSSVASLQKANQVVLRLVPPHVMRGLFLSAWAAFWGIIALRTLRFQFHWKSAALTTLLIASVAAASFFLHVQQFIRDDSAVLVTPTVSVREGDGAEFAEVTRLSDAEGRVVTVVGRRGDWMQIALDGGTTGWIEPGACEEI